MENKFLTTLSEWASAGSCCISQATDNGNRVSFIDLEIIGNNASEVDSKITGSTSAY